MAVTNKAIVVADTGNPAGGFTDAEYQSIGVTFDTLVDPVDRAAFGDAERHRRQRPRDHVLHARRQRAHPPGALGVTLGFFFPRDLFPKTAAPGPCAGSNVAEMFYLLVPDTGGVVNGNKRSKSLVLTLTNGTVAHEYQHLINASRRMYVNGVGPAFEEPWLDEGLAHVAEELNFFRSANRSPTNEPRRDGIQRSELRERVFRLRDQQFPSLQPVSRRDRDAVADRIQRQLTTISRRAARSGTSCAMRPTIFRPARRTRSGSTS